MIYVAAGGNGTRISADIVERGLGNIPKHLLPTGEPGGETLLSRNVRHAVRSDTDVAVMTNKANHDLIDAELTKTGLPPSIARRIAQDSRFGPFSFTSIMKPSDTAYSIGGDIYIEDLDWHDFQSAHEATEIDKPVSFLVGRTSVGPQAAVFEVDESGSITDFYRPKRNEDNVNRNIGVYAFTLSPPVIEILDQYANRYEPEQQDKIALDLIGNGLVRAHVHAGRFFNINAIQDYDDLRAHTARSQTLDAEKLIS